MNPRIIYGTAWKEENTTSLVQLALKNGFRAIDTANQPKHYQEALTGNAIAASGISRSELFIQTKYTSMRGQDHRIPYDAKADLATQVRQSLASSLEHLQTDYLDSYLVHGPISHPGLGEGDFEVWQAMEEIHRRGSAKSIGISNVNALQLSMLLDRAAIAPKLVQNRCLASGRYDGEVREICRQNGITYQGFWLLTGNRELGASAAVAAASRRLGKTPAQICYRFFLQEGVDVLTGTSDAQHMREALDITSFELTPEEMTGLRAVGG